MLEQSLRHHYQRWLVDPIVPYIAKWLTPNQTTCLSGLFGIAIIPSLFYHQASLAIFLMLISGYCDILDGSLARYTQQTSAFGSALDIMIDRVVEFAIILALWLVDPNSRSLLCLFMLGSMLICITSFLVVGIFTANNSHKSFHYSPGLMERAEAFIFFGIMIILPSSFNLLATLFCLLVFFTTLVRLVQFQRATDISTQTGDEYG